jgi:hypothetical protein
MNVLTECKRCGRWLEDLPTSPDNDTPVSTLVCPACGHHQLRQAAATDLPAEKAPWPAEPVTWRRDLEPHRGTLVLVLGLLSLVFMAFLAPVGIPLGIIAWVMGRTDLAKIRARQMDPEGERQTYAGYFCGKVGAILSSLMTVLLCGTYAAILGIVISFGPPGAPVPPPKPGVEVPAGEQPQQPQDAPGEPKDQPLEKTDPNAKPDTDKPSPSPEATPKD